MRIFKWLLVVGLLALATVGGWVAGRAGVGSPGIDPATLPDRERAFVEQLTGASLAGMSTSTRSAQTADEAEPRGRGLLDLRPL